MRTGTLKRFHKAHLPYLSPRILSNEENLTYFGCCFTDPISIHPFEGCLIILIGLEYITGERSKDNSRNCHLT